MSDSEQILVFGKSGQMAQALQDMPGVTVECLGRDQADLTDPELCAARIRERTPAMIINAAAYTDVDGAESDEATAELVNAAAPTAMALAAAERDLPFVSISTDYVFNGSGELPWNPQAPVNPLGAYGATKAKGEAGIMSAGGRAAVLRTSWVFSSIGKNFVKTMLSLAETRDTLTIIDDQIGGPTEARDLAQASVALALALSDGRASPGIYHYSGTPDVSWAGFAREIFAQSDKDVAVLPIGTAEYPARPAQRPLNSRLDCDSFVSATGLTRPDWRLSLARVLNELN